MSKSSLPSAASLVSVLLDGRWLEGHVVESSAASGEFLVEFEDEGEGQAWCSISQPWRRLGPSFGEAEDANAASEPSISEPAAYARMPEAIVEPSPLQAEEELQQPRSSTPADEQSGEQHWQIVLSEFAQLHEASVQSDG